MSRLPKITCYEQKCVELVKNYFEDMNFTKCGIVNVNLHMMVGWNRFCAEEFWEEDWSDEEKLTYLECIKTYDRNFNL